MWVRSSQYPDGLGINGLWVCWFWIGSSGMSCWMVAGQTDHGLGWMGSLMVLRALLLTLWVKRSCMAGGVDLVVLPRAASIPGCDGPGQDALNGAQCPGVHADSLQSAAEEERLSGRFHHSVRVCVSGSRFLQHGDTKLPSVTITEPFLPESALFWSVLFAENSQTSNANICMDYK